MKRTAPMRNGPWEESPLPTTGLRRSSVRAYGIDAPGVRMTARAAAYEGFIPGGTSATLFQRPQIQRTLHVPAGGDAAVRIETQLHAGTRGSTRTVVRVGAGASVVVEEVLRGDAAGRSLFAGTITVYLARNASVLWRTTVVGDSGFTGMHLRRAVLEDGASLAMDLDATLTGTLRCRSECILHGAGASVRGGTAVRLSGHAAFLHDVFHDLRAADGRVQYRERVAVDDLGRAYSALRAHIAPAGQGADCHHAHKALLLSEDASARAVPSLEIEADAVRCGHGSTTSRLDALQQFYLASRGIAPEDSRRMLVDAFLADAALSPIPAPSPAFA